MARFARSTIGGGSVATLAVTAALSLAMLAPASAPASAAVPGVSPASAPSSSTAYAVIRTIGVGLNPAGVAVNLVDDTVYVTNFCGGSVSVINGRAGLLTDDTIPLAGSPWGITIQQAEDTVYVTNYNASRQIWAINGRATDDSRTVTVGAGPIGVAVDQSDDTVYVTNYDAGTGTTMSVINGRATDDSKTIAVGGSPWGVAVNSSDDTVYVVNSGSFTVSVINGRTTDDSETVNVGTSPLGVAVNEADDTVYVVDSSSNNVSVMNGRATDDSYTIGVGSYPFAAAVNQTDGTVYVTNAGDNTASIIHGLVDDTISVGNAPAGIAVDDTSGLISDLVYVANYGTLNFFDCLNFPVSGSVSVIARVSPSLGASTGSVGDTVSVSLGANLPPGYAVDDSTITSVSFGGTSVPATRGSGNTWQATVPAGSGTAAVTVALNGDQTASAGTFTYAAPGPGPGPVYPPSAPRDVRATPGDQSAAVAWLAPANSGSFPVSSYKATAAPGGQSCLATAPALSCTVTGLTNGTAYTFTVEALNGAGWSAASGPSASVTPSKPVSPSIVLVKGPRTPDGRHDRVSATGTTVGIEPGTTLTPHVRYSGQSSYVDGLADITVRADGGFTWSRLVRSNRRLFVYVSYRDTESNTVVWTRVR